MADECVVCGEAEEGKPLYKKLGSGEFNVEVITALKALQMVNIPEAAKNSSYICWDCDELIVEQYDSYLQEQQEVAVLQKQTKKQQQQQSKKKKKSKPSRLKLKISKTTKQESSWGIAKPQPQKQSCKKLSSAVSSAASSLSKTKQLEQQRATNAYHYSHCLMCDSNFETESRTYQRFSLKNRVNDEMDIAQVMEVLGLARHIAPNMKARRFVCNPCFFIIRRNYKDKLMKEASSEAKPQPQPPTPVALTSQSSIHRATTEEHAAEIARLLPPDLAECYKIMTENPGNKKAEAKDTSQTKLNEGGPQAEVEEHGLDEEEGEEEEGALRVSQDEHGNYFIDIDEKRSPGGSKVKAERKEQLAVPRTPRRKKNVLLPKRMHKHLSLSTQDTSEGLSDTSSGEEEKEQEDKEEEEEEGDKMSPPYSSVDTPQEFESSRTCNICGITIAGKQSSWWHTLSSPLTDFDNISISTALKLLETCLASISQGVQEDQSVCLPCYSKVSTGFKSQVVQRIARHKNVDVSEVNLSRVKLRMLPKEALEPVEAPGPMERTTEAAKADERPSATPPAPEESGEGEKENVNVEKRGHKRKYKEDNGMPDKKRNLHKSGVDVTTESVKDSTETELNQDSILLETPAFKSIKGGKRIFCPRAKNGRFLKRNRNNSTRQEQHEAGIPVSSSNQEKNMQDTPAIHEVPRRQPRESIEAEPMVVLKDLKFVLPQEAFIGKTVSSHKIESIMEPPSQPSNQLLATHTDLDSNSSPLQLVFSALSVYCPPVDDPMLEVQEASTPEHHVAPKVCGLCVVCGSSFTLPPSSWHTVEDNIRPPTLLVPVRWVCLSLAICLPQVSLEDARLARVCEQCFQRLGDQFEVFVKKKVGESCGLEADAVDLSEYLFTFNPNTMNLEADPKQQSYIHEFEDVGQLLQRIQPLVEQFSLDEVVGEGKRQPLSDQHFCVWLLLVLNELRMQVGAAIGDLAQWLVALMPIEMYESGLRPCPNNLASFLLNTTRCFRDLTQDMLEGPIPAWVFVANETFQATDACVLGTSMGNENEDEDVCWEDFLQHVNLDALVGGKAKPVAPAHFTQGLVYAMWRTSRLLGEEENQVMDWLKQLSPLPLGKEELESLVTMIGKLHDHLEEHPGDIHELQCKIIPQLQGNYSEKTVHMVLGTETYESCKSKKNRSSVSAHSSSGSKEEENRSAEKRPRMKNRKGSPALRSSSQKKDKRLRLDKSCVNADEQESESCRKVYSQGATVSSLSQSTSSREDLDISYVYSSTNLLLTTPTISTHAPSDQISPDHTSHEPHPVNMSHNSHPVTRHTAEQCSSGTTQVTNTIHTKETGVSSELCEVTADISGPSEDTKDTSETSEEKTATTSEKTESTTESAGETVVASELSEAVATSELSEEAMATSESSEETVATSEPLEETVATSELSEEIVATSEPSEEALASSDSSVEIVAISKPSKEAANITEPTEEISVSTTKCFEEIAANSKTSEETVTTSEPSEGTVTTGGPSEGTVTTSEPSEGTVTTGEPSKETVTTSKPSEGTVTTSEPSKGTVMTSEPSKGIVTTSETSEWTVTTTDPSVGTVTTSESSEMAAVTSGSSEETIATTEPPVEIMSITKSPEMTATTKTPEEALATTEPSEETVTASESLSEAPATAESSEETTSITESSGEVAATTEPAEETAIVIGETNATCLSKEETEGITEPFGVTAVPVDPSKETATIAESANKTTSTIESTEETMTSTEPSEETATTTRETVVTTELVEETVITHGLCKDPKVTTGPPKGTEMITEETAGIVGSSGESIATTTSTSSIAFAGMTVTTSQAQTAANRTDVITSTTTTQLILCSPPTKLQVATPCPEDTANNLQVGITQQRPRATMNIVLGSAKTPHLVPTLVKTNASSNTTLMSPSQKDNSVTTEQYSVIKVSQNEASSKKTSCQALDSGSQVLLQKSHGGGSQIISDFQSALRESPETLAELEQKNEGHFISKVKENCSSSGSKTLTLRSKDQGLSNTSAKVHIVTPPNRAVDKQHQMNKSVSHGKEKESLQLLNKCLKTDAPLKKNLVLPSKDTGPISNKSKLSLEVPVLSTRSPLHRSERVCIKVLTTSPESSMLESHNSENSVGGSKGIVWQYHDPCKERLKTEKTGDDKGSHFSAPTLLWTHQEGKEDNNNSENPSLCHPRTSSKSIVKFVNSAPIKDRLKHPAKSEKYKLGDTKPSIVQIVKEKNSAFLDKRYRNTVSIKKITAMGDKKHINTSVEFHYNKEEVEEMPQKSVTEKNKVVRIFHKQVSIQPVKEEVQGNKIHEKMPGKSLLSEEKEQPKKGKFSSPVTRSERRSSAVTTPCDRGATSRMPQGPSEKKQKLSFEELMNYDVAGIGNS